MSGELWSRSATDLAQLIQKKEVSSVEVVESHLGRIEAVNPAVNAITVVLRESRDGTASRCAIYRKGEYRLHGFGDDAGSSRTRGGHATS